MGCASKAIPLILVFLAGVVWSANQFYQQPFRHFYLPSWAYVVIGGVAVFILSVVYLTLNTISNTAAIWAAGLSGNRRDRTEHVETQERIQELAGVQRVESAVINTLLREKNDYRRELDMERRKALPAPEEPPMVRFDPTIIDRLRAAEDEADVVIDNEWRGEDDS